MQRQDFVPLLTLNKKKQPEEMAVQQTVHSVGFFTLKIDKNVMNFKLE